MERTTTWRDHPARWIRLALLIGIMAASLVPAASGMAATTFTNPLKQNGADPWLQYYGGSYYLMTTTWSSELTMRRASSLAGLASAPSVQIWTDTTASRCCAMWAPEFHQLSGPNGTRWYIYYTAGTSGACCDTQRLHVLESAGSDPLGPYSYKGQLLPGWAIDGSLLTLNSKYYLLYSAWEGANQNVYMIALSNPWTVSGSAVRIATPTYSWEQVGANVNEGPVALQRGGKTFIIYSASSCNTPDYKLGMLTYSGGTVLSASSWVKSSSPVFQRSDANGVYGPGHNGFFKSPDGSEDWVVYHANVASGQGCGGTRSARAQKISWNSDGTPKFGTPAATSAALTLPSGDTGAAVTSFELVNRNSGKLLDLENCATADGTNVRQWSDLNNSCQRWSFQDTADGYYRIVSAATGKVLDVENCATADGANVRQWSNLSNSCQQWSLVATDGGYVRIVNRYSGKVLDVENCAAADGTNVRQWGWLSNACQQWKLQS
ncbi:family 43 glycosylhydrolase [Chloroflexia bacterium SDU3-3]|nr:family 43 glycosylhydrolase [Chloroflexia bacterium SDU3-3]